MSDDAERNQRILQLFLAGATYKQIAAGVDIDAAAVHDIVCRELDESGQRRTVLLDEARAVYQERTEALFKAHWAPALRGDHKSAEICRKILEQHARFFGNHEQYESKGNVVDEISARRAARRGGASAYSSRAKNSV